MPVNREPVEQSRLGTATGSPDEEEPPTTDAQVFQESVLLAIRELCIAAARRYWQTKRSRPHLGIDVPSPCATRRKAPYPERQRGNVPPTRHFHDPRRVLPWTRDPAERGVVYSDSLEELVWRISEQEWTQATAMSRDRSAAGAHAERLTAVHRMSRLYSWAQTVIQAVEMVHFDHKLLSQAGLTDVMLAARDLTVWLLAEDEKNKIQQIWAQVIQLGAHWPED